MAYTLVKYLVALPLIIFLGVMMILFLLIGAVGWGAMQVAGVCFGIARGILTAYEKAEHEKTTY